jgi:hypothetical protein
MRRKNMSASMPLVGLELVDCARANAREGKAIACQQCGYEQDQAHFETELRRACEEMGIHLTDFTDLLDEPQKEKLRVEFAPESPTQL